MIEHAGQPALLILNQWHIADGRVYGFDADNNRYVSARLDVNAEQRPNRGGRVQGEGYTFVLSRPLGTLD